MTDEFLLNKAIAVFKKCLVALQCCDNSSLSNTAMHVVEQMAMRNNYTFKYI